MRLILLGALASTVASAPVLAQNGPPERESSLIVYGEDPCPRSTNDEIVVCARRPEEERYRIPAPLREQRDRPLEVSMNSRAAELDEVQRDTRPGGCSVVGSAGQTGCTQQMIRQWFDERRTRRSR